METLFQDLRYGLRLSIRKPASTVIVLLTLALGIGANTAIFSVVNAVLLRPLPYKDADRLLMVWEKNTIRGNPRSYVNPATFIDWREQNHAFESMAALYDVSVNLTGVGEPERIAGQRASASLFPLLGVEPLLGRGFLPDEDRPGNDNVVVLSHGLWERRFASDPDIVGRPLTLNDKAVTVIGVMPPSFHFPSRATEVWQPLAFNEVEASLRQADFLRVVARLKPEVTLPQAQTELDAIAARIEEQNPRTNQGMGITLVPIREQLVGDIRATLLILLGAVGFVLAVACANVANLLLARATTRHKEMAIRAALGARRLRLIRQLLTEAVALSALGGAAGLLFAFWGVDLLVKLLPDSLAEAREASIDGRVLGFTLLVSLLTGVVFGLAPAFQVSRPALNETLKEGGRSYRDGSGRNRVRRLLVVSEVALALVLLIGAGLMIRSFLLLRRVDPGFQPERLLTLRMILPQSRYPNMEKRNAFYDQALERVHALPGVESAAMISFIPMTFRGAHFPFSIEGRPAPGDMELPTAIYRIISPAYFQTMGIPLLAGRAFDERDTTNSLPVIIINRTMAERFWPGEDVLGKRIKVGPLDSPNPWTVIVGVCGEVRQMGLETELRPEMYATYRQDPRGFIAMRDLVVRASGDPLSLAAAIRSEVWQVDRDQPISNVQTMQAVLSEAISQPRFNTMLLAIFSGLALALAAVGIYGVMSYSVTQRTHEIGIRMALGAQPADILKGVVGEGIKLTLIGIMIGIACAAAITRVLASLLYQVSATDLTTFAGVPLLLTVIALAACYLPARRATKVDPCVALRYE